MKRPIIASPMPYGEMILLCAAKLPAEFFIELLIKTCWETYDDFAMDGFPEYPDAARVRKLVFARTGLLRNGWLEQIGEKQSHVRRKFRITPKGRRKLREMER